MNKKDLINTIASNPVVFASTMLAALPKDDRNLISARRLAIQEEQRRQALILKNICPTCGGKLSRGVKDKNNNYKRSWYCLLCNEKHYI